MTENKIYSHIMSAMIQCGAAPDHPIDLLTIGPGLVARGYSQEQIVNVLFDMQADGIVELVAGNRVRLTK